MISFSENGLSKKAMKALNESHNQSEFIRSAIESYVKKEKGIENAKEILEQYESLKNDLRELRNLVNNKSFTIKEDLLASNDKKKNENITGKKEDEEQNELSSEDEEYIFNSLNLF